MSPDELGGGFSQSLGADLTIGGGPSISESIGGGAPSLSSSFSTSIGGGGGSLAPADPMMSLASGLQSSALMSG
jgi:hypothetical protein